MINYIAKHTDGKLSNEPWEISYDDIKMLYEENLLDREECQEVTESSKREESYYAADGHPGEGKTSDWRLAFFREFLYRDVKTDGFVMSYPHGNVIRQGERGHFYRGEKEIYPHSQPSLFRTLENFSTEEEQELYRFVANLRIAEFSAFIDQFDITGKWSEFGASVLYEPLAQHYGLDTEWLDITNDFNVALFFATCRWDGKQWLPLTKEQTEKFDTTKYGVLFHAPYWNVTGSAMIFNEAPVLPIGFQPFMRCHYQYGYGIHMKTPYPLQENIRFEKLHFRHNEKLSRDVFDLMDGGKKIYPHEGLTSFDDILSDIRSATCFSEEVFEKVFETKNTYFTNQNELRAKLLHTCIDGKPIQIGVHPFHLSRQRRRQMNRKYENFTVEKDLGINLFYRPTYHPTATD